MQHFECKVTGKNINLHSFLLHIICVMLHNMKKIHAKVKN